MHASYAPIRIITDDLKPLQNKAMKEFKAAGLRDNFGQIRAKIAQTKKSCSLDAHNMHI